MKRYIIEQEITGVGGLDRGELKAAAYTSNAALAQIAPRAQWIESFVAGDKTFCHYLAEDEAAIHEHARLSGFPASKITEIGKIFDPVTASMDVEEAAPRLAVAS